jgi:hypothetical protein
MKPELTAISRTDLPTPVKKALANGLISGKILDYGAGKGIVGKVLPNVTSYDPYYFPHKPHPSAKFDTVLCLYVLNVVLFEKRKEIIKGIKYYLKERGTAIVAVRTPKDIKAVVKSNWKKVEDGYLTPKNTFQHGLDYKEMTYLADLAHLRIWYKLDNNTYVMK